ncbi:MAG: lipo-like protein [Burkholderiales bacterium]|nr:lipo-like protein [Burkholderiales bacterium]
MADVVAPSRLAGFLGAALARFLAARRHVHGTSAPTNLAALAATLQPCDVILVEGESRFSTGIKYLTQSTWSHAALYVGDRLSERLSERPSERLGERRSASGERACVIEADVVEGVRAVGLDTFAGLHLRICRPVGLNAGEVLAVIDHAIARLGHRYDLKNIIDLVRWLLPTPPVPVPWRRCLIALGSGDPTRAICSTLVAEAFQSVRYPILPIIEQRPGKDPLCPACVDEILHVRHHSLFVPRDFDVSPYFQVVKPTLAVGFDHHTLQWADRPRALEIAA